MRSLYKKEELAFLSLCLLVAGALAGLYIVPQLFGFAYGVAGSELVETALPASLLALCLGAALCMGRVAAFSFLILYALINAPLLTSLALDKDQGVFSATFALFMVAALQRAFPSKGLFAVLGLVAIFIAALSTGLSAYQLMAGVPMGPEQILALIETNSTEALSYLEAHPVLWAPWIVLMLSAVSLVGLYRGWRRAGQSLLPDVAMLGAVMIALGLLSSPVLGRIYVSFFAIKNYDEQAFAYREKLRDRLDHLGDLHAMLVSDAPRGVTIIVIGESANRYHLHRYGYQRQTTPEIEKINPKNLFVFTNVISSSTATTLSLTRALTTASIDSGKKYYDASVVSVIEALRAAGLQTRWISNQAQHGLWNQSVSDIAGASHELWFSEKDARGARGNALLDTKTTLRKPFDEILIEQVEAAIGKAKRPAVLFVHLMGSHGSYKDRYPAAFDRFKTEEKKPSLANGTTWQQIDAYDNSILYTDYVLARLVALLEKSGGESSLLYFSDHSESPFLQTTHDPSQFTIGDVEIPFLLWLSDAYQERRPGVRARARKNLQAPFMLDHLSQFLFDLTGAHGPFYQPERSLLSAAFRPLQRFTMDGAVDYEALPEDYCQLTERLTGFDPGACGK